MSLISRQFLLYLLCAGCAAAANFLAGFLLIRGLGLTSSEGYPFAIATGYTLGMAINFSLNRRFTFPGNDRTRFEQARTFIIVALSGLVLTTAIASVIRPMLGMLLIFRGAQGSSLANTTGQVLTIAIVSLYSFTAHKCLTFNRGIRYGLMKIPKMF